MKTFFKNSERNGVPYCVTGADAEHIVRCVDAHNELVAALRMCDERFDVLVAAVGNDGVTAAERRTMNAVRAALAKVSA